MDDSFEIRWDKKAVEFLRKLNRSVSRRIVKKVDEMRCDPNRYLEPLREVSVYKLRVGDYRVIVDVDRKQKIIFVLLIGHRRKIYKRLR